MRCDLALLLLIRRHTMKHSPAPWRIIRSSDYTDNLEDTSIQLIKAADGTTILFTDSGYFKPKEENISLIIAAPYLLEALKLTLASLQNWIEIADEEDKRDYDATAVEKALKALDMAEHQSN
jgi:hypothetical protein